METLKKIYFVILLVIILFNKAQAIPIDGNVVSLHVLDKITSRVEIIEIKVGEIIKFDSWVKLSDDFEVLCFKDGFYDSGLAIKTTDKTILNVNDCAVINKAPPQSAQVQSASLVEKRAPPMRRFQEA